jgi:hypothetical protein
MKRHHRGSRDWAGDHARWSEKLGALEVQRESATLEQRVELGQQIAQVREHLARLEELSSV